MNAVVTKRDNEILELQRLIRKMKVPSFRKTATSTDNFRWLNRNIGVQNANHPNLPRVMEILKELI